MQLNKLFSFNLALYKQGKLTENSNNKLVLYNALVDSVGGLRSTQLFNFKISLL